MKLLQISESYVNENIYFINVEELFLEYELDLPQV